MSQQELTFDAASDEDLGRLLLFLGDQADWANRNLERVKAEMLRRASGQVRLEQEAGSGS